MKRLVPCQFCRGALETRRKSPVGGSKWRIRFPSKLGAREYEAEADERDPGKRRARGSQIFQLSMLRGIPLKERNEEIFFVRASIEKGNEIRVARVQLELRRESQIDSSG